MWRKYIVSRDVSEPDKHKLFKDIQSNAGYLMQNGQWKGVRNKRSCSVLCCYPNRPRHGETAKRRSRCPSKRQEPGNSTHGRCSVSAQFPSKTALVLDILFTPVKRHIVGFCFIILPVLKMGAVYSSEMLINHLSHCRDFMNHTITI